SGRCAAAALHAQGLDVMPQADITTLLASLRRGAIDAAVLQDDERQLPHWMAALGCQAAAHCPTIILGPGGPAAIARALGSGATDYAPLSEGLGGAAARLRARVRMQRGNGFEAVLRVDGYTLSAADQRVRHGDHSIALTRCEFGMAWLLFDNRGRVVSTHRL